MAKRSGSLKTLRDAAVYAANDTWYAVTNIIQSGQEANSLLLYVDATVASPGDVEFKIEHTFGNPTAGTYYEFGTGGETPEIFGPIAFTGIDAKSLVIPGLLPNEQIKVFFRASANATSAKLEIKALSYMDESGVINTDLTLGDIEVTLGDSATPGGALGTGPSSIGSGYKAYEDTSFVTGETGVTHDINTDLGRNGNQGYFSNDGNGDLSIQISESGAVTSEDAIPIEAGEVFSLDGLDVDQIDVTWIADTAYRIFIK